MLIEFHKTGLNDFMADSVSAKNQTPSDPSLGVFGFLGGERMRMEQVRIMVKTNGQSVSEKCV